MRNLTHYNPFASQDVKIQASRPVFFDATTGGSGIGNNNKSPAEQASQSPRINPLDQEELPTELAKQRDKLPKSTYEKAEKAARGSSAERALVQRFVKGYITVTQFDFMIDYLTSPSGSDEMKKLKTNLARKELTGIVKPETFELAASALEYGDKAQVAMIQKFAAGGFRWSAKKLKKELDAAKPGVLKSIFGGTSPSGLVEDSDREKDVTRTVDSTHGDIKSMMATVREMNDGKIPPEKDREPFLREGKNFETLTAEMMSIQDAFDTSTTNVAREVGNPQLAEHIGSALDDLLPVPVRADEPDIRLDQVQKALQDLGTKHGVILTKYASVLHQHFVAVQRKQREVMASSRKLKETIDPTREAVEKKLNMQTVLESYSHLVGIPLKAGQRFRYKTLHLNEATGSTQEDFVESEILGIKFDEYTHFNASTGRHEPQVGGNIVILTGIGPIPLPDFKDRIDKTDGEPLVTSQSELEETIELNKYDISLTEGRKLEYETFAGRTEKGNAKYDTNQVTITKITGDSIELDTPVTLIGNMEQGSDTEKFKHIQKKQLTYGEFARWYLRRNVEPVPKDMAELNHMLSARNQHNNKAYDRDPRFRKPIQLRNGEFTWVREDTARGSAGPSYNLFKAGAANDDGEVMLDGRKVSGAKFLKSTKKYELQAMNEEDEADEETASMEEGEDKEEQQAKIKKEIEEKIDEKEKELEEKEKKEEKDKKAGKEPPEPADDGIPKTKTHVPSSGKLRQMWNETTFLSGEDIGQLTGKIWEYIKRRWHHKSEARFAGVGQFLPGIGTEMERIHQAGENHEVGEYESALKEKGKEELIHVLHQPSNQDQMKAAFIVLAGKGWLDWGDIHMWETLNNYVRQKDPSKRIQIPETRDPNSVFEWPVGSKRLTTGHAFLQDAVDALWSQGTYVNWYNQNNSAYNGKVSAATTKGELLEGDPRNVGGVGAELQNLLNKHLEGEFVESAEYEGLIKFIIEAGKVGVQAKLYCIVQGVRHGLIDIERVSALNSANSNRFPVLDFLTEKNHPKPPQDPKEKRKTWAWTKKDFEKLGEQFDECGTGLRMPNDKRTPYDGFKDKGVDKKVDEYLWEVANQDEATRIRVRKGLGRDTSNMDHEDLDVIIPLASPSVIQEVLGKSMTNKQNFTAQGLVNVYVGLTQNIKSLTKVAQRAIQNGDKDGELRANELLIEGIKTAMMYDSILDARLDPDKNTYRNLDEDDFKKPTLSDTKPATYHKLELKSLIFNIGKAFGGDEKQLKLMFERMDKPRTKEETKKMKDISIEVKNFGRTFTGWLRSEKDKEKRVGKLLSAVEETKLTGYADKLSPQEIEKRKKAMGEVSEEELV